MTTWRELQKNLNEELSNLKNEILCEQYPEDRIHEIVDSWIPIYNCDLATLLSDNPELGYVEDSGLIDHDNIDVFKIIQVSVYESLSQIAYEWLEENREEDAA